MKKIFTMILLVAGSASIANAQFKNQKDMVYNDTKKTDSRYDKPTGNSTYNDSYFFAAREKAARLQKINADFDHKIAMVKGNRFLNRWEKAKQVQKLEDQKKFEIWQVEQQYAKKDYKAYDKDKGHDNKKW